MSTLYKLVYKYVSEKSKNINMIEN